MDAHPRGNSEGRRIDRLISFVAGEWILTRTPYTANGGTVVAARTLWLTGLVYVPTFFLVTTFGEGKVFEPDIRQGAADFVALLPWLGAIVAAVYAGFYTRFSSQWTYLAGLYNQIIQTEISMPADVAELRSAHLVAWKAGFIEDAEDLHLASKPLFLVAVRNWARDEEVAAAYAENTVGGEARLKALVLRSDQIWERANRQIVSELPTATMMSMRVPRLLAVICAVSWFLVGLHTSIIHRFTYLCGAHNAVVLTMIAIVALLGVITLLALLRSPFAGPMTPRDKTGTGARHLPE
jgi:uncharacterized membrane protein YuzA (DUF378 family)